jgi:pyruvate kinase
MRFGLDLGADWVAMSFVQRPEDVAELRKLIGGRAKVLAKLEKPAAIDRLGEIIDLSDSHGGARRLGVNRPDVPALQKQIIAQARRSGKPVIVATQMLDSMVHNPAPTRAEVSDVATAIYDGADAVMLSAETASGDFPLESVSMMNRIIERVERDPLSAHPQCPASRSRADRQRRHPAPPRQVAHAIRRRIVTCDFRSTVLRVAREASADPLLMNPWAPLARWPLCGARIVSTPAI